MDKATYDLLPLGCRVLSKIPEQLLQVPEQQGRGWGRKHCIVGCLGGVLTIRQVPFTIFQKKKHKSDTTFLPEHFSWLCHRSRNMYRCMQFVTRQDHLSHNKYDNLSTPLGG